MISCESPEIHRTSLLGQLIEALGSKLWMYRCVGVMGTASLLIKLYDRELVRVYWVFLPSSFVISLVYRVVVLNQGKTGKTSVTDRQVVVT